MVHFPKTVKFQKLYPSSVHITAVVLEYKTKLNRIRKGVATNFLLNKIPTEDLKPTVPMYIRKSQFRLPFRFQTPIIMIGPGTGLAPFRGFIQERDFYRNEGRQIGATSLYYGCRNRHVDYLYEEELEQYKTAKTLTDLHVAFSRDQQQKIYVTHLLRQQAKAVWALIKENGHIYVCG
jgi:NADPH-ferrihemoprotein reductase